MNHTIFDTIGQLESQLARVKAELHFVRESESFRVGAEHERHRILRLIAQRIQDIDEAEPGRCAGFRRAELVILRRAILEAES